MCPVLGSPSFGSKSTQSDEPCVLRFATIGGCSDDQVYCDGFTETVTIKTYTRPSSQALQLRSHPACPHHPPASQRTRAASCPQHTGVSSRPGRRMRPVGSLYKFLTRY